MAKHHAWLLVLCLQTCVRAAGASTESLVVNGILGESATLPLNIEGSQKIANIFWISEIVIGSLTPGVSGGPPVLTVGHGNYLGRIKVIDQSYNLVISDLRMEDAGNYTANISINSSTTTIIITKHYSLYIYHRLKKPKITQNVVTFGNSTCNVTLTCSVEKEEMNVTYSWSPLKEESNVLQIFQTTENQVQEYTCTVQNPVSSNSSSISAQQFCSGVQNLNIGLLIGLVVFFLLVLISSAVLLFYFFKKRKDAASPLTVYASVKVPRPVKPAEHQIYSEISQCTVLSSKENKSADIVYSTVQHPKKMGNASTQYNKPPKTLDCEVVIDASKKSSLSGN